MPDYSKIAEEVRKTPIKPLSEGQIDYSKIAEEVKGTQQPKQGFLKTIAKEVIRPFAEFGSTALNVINATKKIASGDVAGANEELDRVRMSDFLGEVKPIFKDQGPGGRKLSQMSKETLASGLELSSYLPFGLGVKGVVQQTLKGKVLQGLKIGAKEGTIGGTMIGAGGALKEDGSPGEVVSETIKGGVAGAVGGTLLGGLAPVVGKVVRKILFPLEKAKTAVTEAIDKGIRPSVTSLKTQVMRNKYYQKATEAFHTINKYRPSLTEETGEVVQRNPQNRAEMLEAVNQGKQIIFSTYDAIARKAGDFATSLFSPRAIIGKLRAISKDLSYNPQVRSYAETIIPEISELQGASPKVVQERIADLNSTLEGFFQGRVDKAKTRIDLSIAQAMREQLDKLIESATGQPYQALKNEYGALKAIEGDLARQVAAEARKGARSIIDFTDIFTGGDVLAGVIFQNPALVAKGLTGQALKGFYKYLNNPNRFIRNAFEAIEKFPKGKSAVPPKPPLKKPPTEAAGALAGIEPEYDEEGKIKGYKYNPTKGALGILGMTAAKKSKPFNLTKNANVTAKFQNYTSKGILPSYGESTFKGVYHFSNKKGALEAAEESNGFAIEFTIPKNKLGKVKPDEMIRDFLDSDEWEDLQYASADKIWKHGTGAFEGKVQPQWINKIYDSSGKQVYLNPNYKSDGMSKSLYHVTDFGAQLQETPQPKPSSQAQPFNLKKSPLHQQARKISFVKRGKQIHPLGETFDIISDGKNIGHYIGKKTRNDFELFSLTVKDEFQKGGIGTNALLKIFQDNPKLSRIIIDPTKASEPFWKKVGAEPIGLTRRWELTKSQLTDIWNEAKGTTKPTGFQGFKDLTTKFLDYAKGKTTLSKQEIIDFSRRPELKKGEADLLKNLSKDLPDGKIPAQEFADSIRRDLLELKPVKVKDPQYKGTTIEGRETGIRSPLGRAANAKDTNYEEVVFESPITTNGSSHFPNSKKYFAHARGDEVVESGKKIWREQEIQSDLLQKDRMQVLADRELNQTINSVSYLDKNRRRVEFNSFFDFPGKTVIEGETGRSGKIIEIIGENEAKIKFGDTTKTIKLRDESGVQAKIDKQKELEQLQPFTNDRFGERIMRERIKAKAQAGYEKYRLPTGETIGKIEGFENPSWMIETGSNRGKFLTKDNLKIGDEVMSGDVIQNNNHWIITDILGNGRFKAVPKESYEAAIVKAKRSGDTSQKGIMDFISENTEETFDLTGKSNPQYRRYSDWGKFLKNKYGGKEVIDSQGNSWVEVDIKPEYKSKAIEVFGALPFALSPLLGLRKKDSTD